MELLAQMRQKNVKACAAALGFTCDAPPLSAPFVCEDKCKQVVKSVRDAVTGFLFLVVVVVCATS